MAQNDGTQLALAGNAKTATFSIPESELYRFSFVKKIKLMDKNAYDGYTNEFVTSEAHRSTSERLFEQFCEGFDSINWVYKNGDVWIIETKGGEQSGHTKNIDIQVNNKFSAFKEYAKRYNIKWGFVRDKDENLYFCNTDYTEDMSSDNWQPLEEVLR